MKYIVSVSVAKVIVCDNRKQAAMQALRSVSEGLQIINGLLTVYRPQTITQYPFSSEDSCEGSR
jgi:hypothetical protein